MILPRIAAAASALLLLAACEARIGEETDNQGEWTEADASAEGKAEEGKISMKGPGFDIAFKVPGGLADHANVDGDNKIIYPGATISGMHIAAGADKGRSDGEVEMRFTSRDSLDKVAAWYRDPARAEGFTLESARREGDGIAMVGATKGDSESFSLHLSPRQGNGTQGRLTIRDRG